MDSLLPIAERIGALLKQRKQTIAISESSAGGLISAALLAVPGASAYYLGGAVVYTRDARTSLLGIPREAMEGVPPSTEAYALVLARGARERLGTTWALAEIGATGPTGNRYGYPAGHACFAVAGPLERGVTLETGSGDRIGNMRRFGLGALELLEQVLNDASRP
jgi:nicotinamide-nucleotide amidase